MKTVKTVMISMTSASTRATASMQETRMLVIFGNISPNNTVFEVLPVLQRDLGEIHKQNAIEMLHQNPKQKS